MIEPVILGDCTLYCGDCLHAGIEPESIDLTVTSPPYDNLRTYNGSLSAFKFEPIAQMLYRVTKPGGVVVWVVGDETIDGSETLTSFKQALYFRELGFNVETMIYHTPGTGAKGSNYYYWQAFEYMFILSKGQPKTSNRLQDKKNKYSGHKRSPGNKQTNVGTRLGTVIVGDYGIRPNVWEYYVGNNGDDLTDHPAPFPEQLAKDHILSWSNPGDVIFDPMMGSGTTGKMATKYQRKFVGCEVNTEYFEIAVKRIKQAQLQIRMEI